MGMDAKANVFYGYKVAVDGLDDEGDYRPVPDGVNIVIQFDNCYLAIAETNQRFDWDYGIQELSLDQTICFDDKWEIWNNILKEACELFDLKFDTQYCGWFVVCDYR